jgi:glutaredoxin
MAEFIIYTKQSCEFCGYLKKYLNSKKKTYEEIDIYKVNSLQTTPFEYHDKESFFKKLNELVIWNTFPIVFKDNKFIGGYSETKDFIEKEEAFQFL